MRIITYISGIGGVLLILTGLLGFALNFENNTYYFIAGAASLFILFVPLILINRYKENKKLDAIIESYRNKEKKEEHLKPGESKTRGWSMNNSPFRKRKSGVTWEGGKIHAANARRGERK